MTSQPRLIILDDEPMVGQTIQGIAEAAGYSVLMTLTAEDFFRAVREFRPDCLAIDLIMPNMDGVQVMESLARQGCRAGIIVTSGSGHRVLEAAGRAATENGLDILGILHKPFRPAELRSLLVKQTESDSRPRAAGVGQPVPAVQSGPITDQELRAALVNDELFVVYQPKVDCRSGAIAGFEALARWRHPQRGLVVPDEFIPLAEAHGLIDALTERVFEHALRWFANLVSGGPVTESSLVAHQWLQRTKLSINISPLSLGNEALFEHLIDFMRSLDIAPDRVIFELTESSAMEDRVASLGFLTRLRIKGFHLAIDDFGTGFSSMLQLVRLPFSEIKIDKSFVMTASSSQESRSVTKSVIDLGRSLGLQSTAEGVEDEIALHFLRDMGCDLAQGYFISAPMEGDAAIAWTANRCRVDEEARVRTLHSLGILDTPPEERFDRITRLATRIFNVPVAMVTLVDAERQWFKSAHGSNLVETPREGSFCIHTIQDDDVFVVRDALQDERFCDNPLVTNTPQIRFYAGYPLVMPDGARVGTLCIIDSASRSFADKEAGVLRDLAAMVERELLADRMVAIDPLTGLLNRDAFENKAAELLNLCNRHGRRVVLMLFDLDEYWDINAREGSSEGDRMLVAFAAILKESLRGSDLIARFGGDEFAALLTDIDVAHAQQLDLRLQGQADEYNRADMNLHVLKYGCGITGCGPGDSYSYQRMLSRADQAIYTHRKSRH